MLSDSQCVIFKMLDAGILESETTESTDTEPGRYSLSVKGG